MRHRPVPYRARCDTLEHRVAQKKLHKPYPFCQRTYEAAPGIICGQDVAVPMRDGIVLYADIFRPADDSQKVPAILAWSNYGKRPNEYRPPELVAYTLGVPAGSISASAKFEAADPEYWVPNGYAVINVDIRGIGYMKLHAWVEAVGHDDMDLFVTVKKLSRTGVEQPVTIFDGTAPHPGAWGKMRVSHRELDPELSSDFQPVQAHRRELKLSPGEVVPIDVEINPTSRIWHAGETIREVEDDAVS